MTGLTLNTNVGKNYSGLPPMSRRDLLLKSAGATIGATVLASAARADEISSEIQPESSVERKGTLTVNTVTTKDGTQIYFKDWGEGQPVLFSHGWPLNSDAWDAQMLFLGKRGFRVIAHDRRGHGRSSQPWYGNDLDTYADDLAQVIEALDLHNLILVGHSTGGGEVVRYLGKYGTNRVSKVITIGAIPPLMLKTDANPGGLPISAFDALRTGVSENRSQFFMDLTLPFYGYNKPGAVASLGIQASFLQQGLLMSVIGAYDCIKAFSETDLTEDLKKIDIPMLLLHGDADQIVPYADASVLAAKIVKNSILKIYPGAPHGVATVSPDMVNKDILAFIG